MCSSFKYVTNWFIMQIIILFLTYTDTKSTTFDISTWGEVWLHDISITPPLVCIEMSVPSQESERSYNCVRDIEYISFYYFSIGFLIYFHTKTRLKNLIKPVSLIYSQSIFLYNSAVFLFSQHLSYVSILNFPRSNFTMHTYFY